MLLPEVLPVPNTIKLFQNALAAMIGYCIARMDIRIQINTNTNKIDCLWPKGEQHITHNTTI